MAQFLVIKTGTALPEIVEQLGDFEHLFADALAADIHVCHAEVGEPVPDLSAYKGIVITGSHSMVTDREAWLEPLQHSLRAIAKTHLPILGVCFGHQLLADTFGGVVDNHPQGPEVGTVPVQLTEAAQSDPIFAELPLEFIANASHTQSVLKLPENAVLLAYNHYEDHHAYRIGERIWGMQFHPEFTAPVMQMYSEHRQKKHAASGVGIGLLAPVTETPVAYQLLQRFKAYCLQN